MASHARAIGERGAALIVALIALVALLGIGGITMLAVQSETRSSGNDRFRQMALFTAESGVAAAANFLRDACDDTTLYSALVEPSNANPQQPAGIAGNGRRPGVAGNLFSPAAQTWYEVTILNDRSDAGFAAGDDTNAVVVVHSVGHGPNQTSVIVEMEVYAPRCLADMCARDYAQEGVSGRNDAFAACATAIDTTAGLRTIAGEVP